MIEADVVVIGAGTAGSAAAARAGRSGARVMLLEKLPAPGGSGAIAVGMFWTAPSSEAYLGRVPTGDVVLAQRLIDDFPRAVGELRSLGVQVSDEPVRGIMSFGVGYSIDIRALLRLSRDEVLSHRCEILVGARVEDLLVADGSTVGVRARMADGTVVEVRAPSVVIATGGFQGDDCARTEHFGPAAGAMLVRAAPGSTGDGLRLARHAGAAVRGLDSGFYGHLMPWPLTGWNAAMFIPYTQYYSEHAILLNSRGERFVDERSGDEISNQELLQQPGARGALVLDEALRRGVVHSELFPGWGSLDRLELARKAGGRYVAARDLDELGAWLDGQGMDGRTAVHTLRAHAHDVAAGRPESGGIPLTAGARALVDPPFHALLVQPSITFTFGGLHTDVHGRVLDGEGRQIPGLFAAGADVGGIHGYGYVGGLASSYITGCWAGESAAAHALG